MAASWKFEDLAVKFNFVQPRQYDTAWFSFDNATGAMTPAAGLDQVGSAYAAARIAMRGDSTKSVTVYIRRNSGAIVGIERVW